MPGSGPTVARAYVAVIPTTRDAQKNISKELLPELDAAGKEGGEKLSGGIGSSLKSGASRLAGIAKAALAGAGVAAVTKFVHDSVGAFSDFEQLKGGVEKIFNEIDTSTIVADAKSAYKELQISANDYLTAMTSVGATFATTLGDAKGYEVAKEGLKAISDFASGTGRSVDLLTEKYTLITRATSSYQSIADQFSGILPATSDEFLRQAKEAGLLGEQYEKLTDVPLPEYQEAVTKMMTEGVAVMGLTDNAANEAFNSLEGSTNMLKASWQNLLVAFGEGDESSIKPALDNMKESIESWASNLVPRIGVILGSIVTSIPGIVQEIITNIPGWISQIGTAISDAFQGVIESIGSVFGVSMDDMMSNQLVQSIMGLGTKIKDSFTRVFGEVDISAVFDMLTSGASSAADTISLAFQSITDTVSSIIDNIDPATIDMIFSGFKSAGEALLSIFTNLKSIVDEVLVNVLIPILTEAWTLIQDTILPKLQEIFTTLQPAFQTALDMLSQAYDWLSQIVTSITEFLQPTIEILFNFLSPIFDQILTALNDILGTAVGVVNDIWAKVEPFINDIVGGITWLFDQARQFIEDHRAEIETVLGIISDAISRVITWVTDTVSGAINSIGEIIGGIVDTVRGIFDIVRGVISGDTDLIKQGFDELVSGIGDIFWGVIDLITSPFRSAFNEIKKLWNNTLGSFSITIPSWVPAVGGNSFGFPRLAEGGTLTRGGTVLVGEAGPELLSLPKSARVTPLDKASAQESVSYNVQVGDVDLSDDAQIQRVTREYLEFLATLARPGAVTV